jgi:hypothetical protein
MRLLGEQRFLTCDSTGFGSETRQRAEELGALAHVRLEMHRRRHRDENLLRRVVVERGTP